MTTTVRTTLESNVASTLSWAKELSELWVNTLVGDIIDRQIEALESAMHIDPDIAYDRMIELGETCDYAAKKEING